MAENGGVGADGRDGGAAKGMTRNDWHVLKALGKSSSHRNGVYMLHCALLV